MVLILQISANSKMKMEERDITMEPLFDLAVIGIVTVLVMFNIYG